MSVVARTNYANVPDGGLDPLWEQHGRHMARWGYIGAAKDPLDGSFRVQRHTVHRGDVLWGGDRCETMTPRIGGGEGARFQVGFRLLLPIGFVSDSNAWNSLWDLHYQGGGPAQSPITVSVRNSTELWIRVLGGPLTQDGTMGTVRVERKVADLTLGRWHTLAWDVLQATDNIGIFATYVDGVRVDTTRTPTLSPGRNTTYWKQGFYRPPNSGGTATYYFGDTICVDGGMAELLPLLGGITAPPSPPAPPVDPCATVKQELVACQANLASTQAALLAATDNVEEARVLCRDQIARWRAEKPARSWQWIKSQPASKAFYGPLGGSW